MGSIDNKLIEVHSSYILSMPRQTRSGAMGKSRGFIGSSLGKFGHWGLNTMGKLLPGVGMMGLGTALGGSLGGLVGLAGGPAGSVAGAEAGATFADALVGVGGAATVAGAQSVGDDFMEDAIDEGFADATAKGAHAMMDVVDSAVKESKGDGINTAGEAKKMIKQHTQQDFGGVQGHAGAGKKMKMKTKGKRKKMDSGAGMMNNPVAKLARRVGNVSKSTADQVSNLAEI